MLSAEEAKDFFASEEEDDDDEDEEEEEDEDSDEDDDDEDSDEEDEDDEDDEDSDDDEDEDEEEEELTGEALAEMDFEELEDVAMTKTSKQTRTITKKMISKNFAKQLPKNWVSNSRQRKKPRVKAKKERSNSFSGYEGWAKAIAHLYHKK